MRKGNRGIRRCILTLTLCLLPEDWLTTKRMEQGRLLLEQLLNIPHNRVIVRRGKHWFENLSCKMPDAGRILVDTELGKFVCSSVESVHKLKKFWRGENSLRPPG